MTLISDPVVGFTLPSPIIIVVIIGVMFQSTSVLIYHLCALCGRGCGAMIRCHCAELVFCSSQCQHEYHTTQRSYPYCRPLISPASPYAAAPFEVPVDVLAVGALFSPFMREKIWQICSSMRQRYLTPGSTEPLMLFVRLAINEDLLSITFSQRLHQVHTRDQEARSPPRKKAMPQAPLGHYQGSVLFHTVIDFGNNVSFSLRFGGMVTDLDTSVDYLSVICSSVQDFLSGAETLSYSYYACMSSKFELHPPPPLPVHVSLPPSRSSSYDESEPTPTHGLPLDQITPPNSPFSQWNSAVDEENFLVNDLAT